MLKGRDHNLRITTLGHADGPEHVLELMSTAYQYPAVAPDLGGHQSQGLSTPRWADPCGHFKVQWQIELESHGELGCRGHCGESVPAKIQKGGQSLKLAALSCVLLANVWED